MQGLGGEGDKSAQPLPLSLPLPTLAKSRNSVSKLRCWKIDKLWHLYIQDDQHELNELKKIYEEWNIKVEASLRQDIAHFGRKSFGKPPYIPHSTCLLDARKAYQMESSSVEGMLPNDIMEVILSKLPYTRFFNAIFRYMRTNSMEESLCLFRKESDIHLINPQAFGEL
ncbi:hypothetical protein AQUCO_00100783v1 [Aquilegia coerulea]|uniref:Uncharacterized protein n=1 Tax=Aquilegia coerulea TaxID=218851 RepID=A0A2G5FC29_AQUCA|nr:hypothetical protein AQUCO_00100783v1 [Aquilegia coerulea]